MIHVTSELKSQVGTEVCLQGLYKSETKKSCTDPVFGTSSKEPSGLTRAMKSGYPGGIFSNNITQDFSQVTTIKPPSASI